MDTIKTGIELYERGLQYLKKYQHDSANGCFRVAYDLLQDDTTVDCYPDLCYYLSKGHSYYRTLEERIRLNEEILEGYERMTSSGKDVPQKRIKEIKQSLRILKYELNENRNRDVVSPDASQMVKGLELIDNKFGYDYTKRSQFHDAEIMEIIWKVDKVILKLNLNYFYIATFCFNDVIELKTSLEVPYIYEMRFQATFGHYVECLFDGVTITCKEVVCEKVEEYPDE